MHKICLEIIIIIIVIYNEDDDLGVDSIVELNLCLKIINIMDNQLPSISNRDKRLLKICNQLSIGFHVTIDDIKILEFEFVGQFYSRVNLKLKII